jgi:hypothetical protein
MSLSNKKRFAKVFEGLLNRVNREDLDFFYGAGTDVKIVTLDFLPTKKVCNIYAKIVLGDNFDDLSLETDLAEMIVYELLADILPDYTGTVSMSIES